MLRNYLRVALRNLYKNKFFTIINVAGLGLGLACVFLIVQYLRFELSYDKFHESTENIYRVAWFDENPQPRTPHPMALAMMHDFPEVENAVSLSPVWAFGLTRRTFSFKNLERDVQYDERNVLAVDTTFFKVFTFPLVKGDPRTALKHINSCLISESTAKKYFGEEDPIGKRLAVNDDKNLVEIVGVFLDVPAASHFHFDVLVSYLHEKANDPNNPYYTWADFGHYNYVKLKPGTNPKAVEAKMMDWIRGYLTVSDEVFKTAKQKGVHFELQPITDIHLRSHILWELEPNGYISYVYILAAAGFLILIIAAVNFINLSTAQSVDRAREIGIRKSLGAYKSQIAAQFTGEAVLVSVMAIVVAGCLIEMVSPFYASVTGKALRIDYVSMALGLIFLGLLTGIIAGIFPSLRLSTVKPTQILKGKMPQTLEGRMLRQSFTTFQFMASMALISCSAVIYSQLRFIQNRPLGFEQDEVVTLPVKDDGPFRTRLETLREELLKVDGVTSVSASSNIPGSAFNRNDAWDSQDPQIRTIVSEEMIDYDFFRVMGITFAEGRPFLRENPADADAFVINEAAAKAIFPSGALGKEMVWDYETGPVRGNIIGIVKDFNYQSLHEPVRPLILRLRPRYNHVLIRVKTDHFTERMADVEKVWRKFENRFMFEFSFLRDELNKQYTEEKNMSVVLTAFSSLAVAIACFGLLGIAALTFRQKTKEVSIRKVMGASVESIIVMLLKDFTSLVIVAIVIAIPLVWWGMNRWLENFTFRTEINPLIFIMAGASLLLLAWVTISYLTLRLAKTNPAETLKNE